MQMKRIEGDLVKKTLAMGMGSCSLELSRCLKVSFLRVNCDDTREGDFGFGYGMRDFISN